MSQPSAVRILSAGAPKAGVQMCAAASLGVVGTSCAIQFATAPVIRERLASGTVQVDVVVAPFPDIQVYERQGVVVSASCVFLGSIETGVAVTKGAIVPDISSATTFREALLAAALVVYNRASSGQYIEIVLDRMGLAEALAGKTVRTDSGAEAMEVLSRDRSGRAIGFGQITEIKLREDLGVQLVGPLPKGLGKRTDYGAGLSTTSANPESAMRLLDFFASEEGRQILGDSGIATPRP
ncbi:MAG: substrate-binding domain-containing protein [Dinoroseobacter sp.]|nr:substrate-binding domain-containing protein [Dinoroseobacter sp.]